MEGSALKKAFYDYIQDDGFEDSEEFQKVTVEVDTFLDDHITLDRKRKFEFQRLIWNSQHIAEEQGFINGFKYAMSLMKECFE